MDNCVSWKKAALKLPTPTFAVTTFARRHADHLGTPRAITRPADNAVVWRWSNDDPFGNNAADENPSGLGTFEYNQRFSGMYRDKETGTFQNYFRDYVPGLGGYQQSDPIGLRGGINTYAYVGGNPLSFIDPRGLEPQGALDFINAIKPYFPGNDIPLRPITPEQCESKCNYPVTITTRGACSGQDENCDKAMIAAGIPGPYRGGAKTYDGTCLAKFGIGAGVKIAVGEKLINEAPNVAAKLGASAGWVSGLGRAATVLNSPPAMVIGITSAVAATLTTCECPSK